MPKRTVILTSFYQDSVVLMRLAALVRLRPGIREAVAFMGTPANHDLLEDAGLATPESRQARPEDLILTVEAGTASEADAALAAARQLLLERRQSAERVAGVRPRTLDSARKLLPGANLVAISVRNRLRKRLRSSTF